MNPPVHGHVLAVQPHGTAVIAIDASVENGPAQTRTFKVIGAPVSVGQDVDGYLAAGTRTFTEVPPPRLTEGVSQASIILDAAVFVVGVAILGGALVWITKRVIIDEKF
jgi:hypothetical protein